MAFHTTIAFCIEETAPLQPNPMNHPSRSGEKYRLIPAITAKQLLNQ
jgi:hypothetical protein